MGNIREYVPMIRIQFRDGTHLISQGNKERVFKAVQNSNWIEIDGRMINTGYISFIESFDGNEIDQYISWITDPIMRQRLESIVKERKDKWFKTSWVQHLMEIYTRKFKVLSDGNSSDGEILS